MIIVRDFIHYVRGEGWSAAYIREQLIRWAQGDIGPKMHGETLAFLNDISEPRPIREQVLALFRVDGITDDEPDATSFFAEKSVMEHHTMNVAWWKNNDPMNNVFTPCRS